MDDPRFVFLDGNPAWLDFVNTRFMLHGSLVDRLQSWDDLVDWLVAAKLIPPSRATVVRSWNGREALHRARKLRETLHQAAGQLEKNGSFPAAALRLINGLLESAPGVHRLVPTDSGFRLDYEAPPKKAVHLLEPLVRAAAEFLTSADLGRVRKCSNERCVLYYHDATKNNARRWCSMSLCGNRMKAAAHYRRSRGES